MGYILPVQHFQYYDYHLRTIDEKKEPYFIGKPFKAVLEEHYQNVKNSPAPRHKMLQNEHSHLLAQYPKARRSFAETTGKGKIFDMNI